MESEMFIYKGSTALITGASKGLGVTFAEELARRGADLVLVARSKDALQTLAARLTAQYGVKCYVIAADLADRCTVQLAYAIGVAEPVSVMVDTFGTGKIEAERLVELIRANFSLTPKGMIDSLQLRRPIYRKTAAFGHFGRTEDTFTWEKTDKAAALKEAGMATASAAK